MEAIQYIVSIDLGSTFSGYSYLQKPKRGVNKKGDTEIKTPLWQSIDNKKSYKIPTALLYNKIEEKYKTFGFNAVNQYQSDEKKDMRLFEGFKKNKDEAKVRTLLNMSDIDPEHKLPTMTLYAEMIRQLSQHCLENIRMETGNRWGHSDVLWILCYPVIWPIQEKEFLRAAAYQAGLLTELTSSNIMIISEAEASFQYTKSLEHAKDFKTKLDSDKEATRLLQTPGILVADAGGSTVDVTIQTRNNTWTNFTKHILTEGIQEGGQKVNAAFESFMSDLLGEKFIDDIKQSRPSLWRKIMGEFEFAKRSKHESGTLSVSLYNAFHRYYDQWCNKDNALYKVLTELENNELFTGVTYDSERDSIIFAEQKIRELFDTTVQPIVEYIKERVQPMDSIAISLVILTGGFSDCDYLEHELKKVLTPLKVGVLVPLNPDMSVMKGAIQYCQSRYIVKTVTSGADYKIDGKNRAIVTENQTLLQGNLYEDTVSVQNLPDPELRTVTILRNEREFITFVFGENANGGPQLKVLLQVIDGMVIVSVSDQTLGETYIKGKSIALEYTMSPTNAGDIDDA